MFRRMPGIGGMRNIMKMDKKNIFDNTFFSTVLDQLDTEVYVTDIETDEIVYMNDFMKRARELDNPEGCICWKVLQKNMSGRCSFCKIDGLMEDRDLSSYVWNQVNTVSDKFFVNCDSLFEWKGRTYHLQHASDITEFQALTENARIDDLTRMMNRRAGRERLNRAVLDAREENKILTVVLCDINELKSINDKYGHGEGDQLLRFVSAMIKQNLGSDDFAFRLSGDEFVVVFYDSDMNDADLNMKKILQQLKDEREKHSIYYEASFSYGIAEIYPGDRYTVRDIISKADGAMYIQKRNFHIMQAKEKLKRRPMLTSVEGDFDYNKEHLYEALTAGTDDYIFVGNMKTGIFRYPPAMVEEFGLPGLLVENAAAFWSGLIHPHDEAQFLESNQEIADGRVDYHCIEYRAKNVHGQWIWLRCRGKMIRDEHGVPDLFAGMISNLGRKNQIDHMTGLYNRFEFEGDIKKYLVDKENVDHMDVMVLDMDSFKDINDLYNRSFGDEILRVTAKKIEDLLPENAKLYRLDGDEFGIIVCNGEREDKVRIFSQIQHLFGTQQEYNGRRYYCTLSAGCVSYPDDADNYLDIQKCANYSLEYSKSMGKNKLTVFTPEILAEKERSLELTELLRESIDRGFAGFSVSYQAQIDSCTKELYGAEALARWRCSKYGNVSPGEFIPLLEKSGLIVEMGSWILYQAIAQCKEWSKYRPTFHMSINLSYLQLLEDNILDIIKQTLEDCGLSAQNITLELTETYLMKNDIAIRDVVDGIRAMGVRIAMDDFGVGYSSLTSLKNTPVDVVKVDRGFVRGITTDLFNAAFIRSITELCHEVGKKVCLEGVETQEEYDAVKDMGFELYQGFYFGHPIDAEMFAKKFL